MRKKKKGFIDTRKWYRYQFFGTATVTVLNDKTVVDASIANISFSGIGLYSSTPIGKGKKVKINISFMDRAGKVQEDTTVGKVDWQLKFKNTYLIGIIFDEELNIINQPMLLEHLIWLINTYNWPQPYKDKRISML
ncbi:MAG: PilZ domain-containing protein [Nitrospirota bacterium]